MKFLHTADIHLDSALAGASRKRMAPIAALRSSTRRAFSRVIDIALEEDVAFVLIAGDLYDAEWRDFGTGLFFAQQIRRLGERPCFLVLGNHDAQSVITDGLRLSQPGNLHLLSARHCETVDRPDLGFAIHGQSFPKRHVNENMVSQYKAPVPGRVNIGLLHTSLDGRPNHDRYAPCDVTDLTARGYDYWALGHVHEREIVCRAPYIVFPGNTQGRSIRESGVRSCTVVHVVDGRIAELQAHATDVLRWATLAVDITGVDDINEVADRLHTKVMSAAETAEGRPMAIRITLTGATSMHRTLLTDFDFVEAECRTAAARGNDDIWLERLVVATSPPAIDHAASNEPLGILRAAFDQALADPEAVDELERELGKLLDRLPPDVVDDDLRRALSPKGLRDVAAEAWEIVAEGLQSATGE